MLEVYRTSRYNPQATFPIFTERVFSSDDKSSVSEQSQELEAALDSTLLNRILKLDDLSVSNMIICLILKTKSTQLKRMAMTGSYSS